MEYNVVETDEIKKNLNEALDYIELVLASPSGAASLAHAYISIIETLATFPNAYPVSNEPRLKRLGYRKALAANYIVLYKVVGNTVYLTNLFHQSQDYTKLV